MSTTRKLLLALGLAGALALPGTAALAAGHGNHGKGHHQPAWAHSHGHGIHGLRQLEGTVVSVATDGSNIVVQPTHTEALTVTVDISTSTVITADEGITTTTLAPGEQVHVTGTAADGVFTALRVVIQKPDAEAQGDGTGGKHTKHGLRQLEGTVVSVATDGSSMVVQPMDTEALTVTVDISTSTVITAEEGITTTTLAPGEQVHVSGTAADGTFTAGLVLIQKPDAEAQGDDADREQQSDNAGSGQHGDNSGGAHHGDNAGDGHHGDSAGSAHNWDNGSGEHHKHEPAIFRSTIGRGRRSQEGRRPLVIYPGYRATA